MANGYAPGMDEEQLRLFLQSQMSQDYGDQEADIKSQRRKANFLREIAGDAKGQMVGDVYVAANPLQHIARVLGAYQGQKGLEGADTATADLAKLRQTDRADFMSGISEYQGMEGADMGALAQSMQASEDPRYAAMGGKLAGQQFTTSERGAREETAKGVRGEARVEAQAVRDAKLERLRQTNEYDKQYYNKETGDPVHLYKNKATLKPVDETGQPIDMSLLTKDKPKSGPGADFDDGLTSNQRFKLLKDYRKEMKPYENVAQSLRDWDKTLSPFAKGGKKGEVSSYGGLAGIPGIGGPEGGAGFWGSVFRIGDKDAQRVAASTTKVLQDVLREAAGLSQTATEVGRTLASMAQLDLSDEQVAIEQMEKLKLSYNRDMEVIRGTTPGSILGMVEKRMGEGAPHQQTFETTDWSNRFALDLGAAPTSAQADAMGAQDFIDVGGGQKLLRPPNMSDDDWATLVAGNAKFGGGP